MKNQCDGCRRGLKIIEGIHVDKKGKPYMVCSKGRYKGTKTKEEKRRSVMEKGFMHRNLINNFDRKYLSLVEDLIYKHNLQYEVFLESAYDINNRHLSGYFGLYRSVERTPDLTAFWEDYEEMKGAY